MMNWDDRAELTLNFVQVAFLIFGQQVGVCIFPGINFPDKEWVKPAVLSVSVARCRNPPENTDKSSQHMGNDSFMTSIIL